MNSIKTLLRLELKARFGSFDFKKASGIIRFVFIALFAIGIYALYTIIIKSVAEMFYYYEMGFEFLVMLITLLQVLLLITGISSAVKTLYYQGDNELLLRFPVSGASVFFSKSLFMIITQFVITILLMFPPLLSYGLVAKMYYGYYLALPFVLIICVAIPFLVSNVLCIPSMKVSSFMRNKYLLSLIISVVFIGCGFFVYMSVITALMKFWQQQSISFFSDATMAYIQNLIKYMVPFRQLAFILTGERLGESIGIVLAILLVLFGAAILIVRKLYLTTVLTSIEVGTSSFKKITKNKKLNCFAAIMGREFREIFRSSNYSFQYLSMAIAGPIMVYFCNKLALMVGANSISATIMPALCLLVMMIFTSVILSFAASAISREGDNFYLTKTAPVSYKLQVSVKLVLYLVVALANIFVSSAIVMATKQVSVNVGFSIMAITVLFAFAVTCFSVKLDMVRPQFPVGGDGELTGGNVATFISMAVGFGLSVVYGIVGIVGIFLLQGSYKSAERATTVTFLILGGATLVFAIASACWLFIKMEKNYYEISQR